MKPLIDFDECLRDSPKFREQLETEEASIDALELKLDKVLKACCLMIESGKTYMTNRGSFTNALWDLSGYFSEDPQVMASLNRMIHSLQEMNKFHSILLDQVSRTVVKNLTAFVKVDIKGVKESKHHFDKISNDLDLALNRNSQVSKHKPPDVEEAVNLLLATRSCFRHTALDHVQRVTMLQARKRHEILATFLSYVQACCTYYHQGADLTEDLEPFLKTTAEEVTTMRNDTKILDKEMENRHTIVNSRDTVLPSCKTEAESDSKEGLGSPCLKNMPRMQGYLFKRTSNAFKTWNRRWFYLYDNRLVYRKRTGELHVTVMEEDLRLCTVRPVTDGERRHCFEVLSPSKSHMLQADSDEMLSSWVAALQHGIRAAIQQGRQPDCADTRTTERQQPTHQAQGRKLRIWEQLLSIPGNNTCCDCGGANPAWASINLGITLCIECSGIHRSLGVHHSKVRSLTLDDWEPDIIKVMAELGNTIVNRIYEANAEGTTITRATPDCDRSVRETWIRAKYVSLLFVKEVAPAEPQRVGRRWSVRRTRRRNRNPSAVPETISDHSEKSDVNSNTSVSESSSAVLMIGTELCSEREIDLSLSSDHDSTEGEDVANEEEDISSLCPQTILYRAALAHNLSVMTSALAARAHVDARVTSHRGRTALHAAVISGSVMACSFLLVNGAKLNVQDDDGKTPLHLATEAGHTAQVCLLLRYRADQSIADNEGLTPLDVAVNNANADIVTLLRLTKLNEEMRDSEMSSNDDTYTSVFRDYTQLAHSHPERLQRRHNNNEGTV
ncbi:arf-GAP with coiled-coil, ANK repeat and PH domain-containing protein 2 [Plutella xylostella]|uniref:arf-GAP with coiled-coil, ANK repeat and PH domain-containing protein 2 n=1 Tax=Plutella xylostella TaxID=51655 RepID=UPI002032C732|nr:arf-GAP with coiled-coil, ANK repeat and PH domain-containing protein 2 [Plutella xylostella]